MQGPCPALTITKGGDSHTAQSEYMTFASVSRPHGGRSEQLWDEALEAVQKTTQHGQKLGQMFVAGGFNTAELRTLLGDDEPTSRQSAGRAGTKTYLRAQQVLQLMNDTGLYSLTPAGGHRPTHVPDHDAQPRTLDYQLISQSLTNDFDCTTTLLDLALATDRKALATLLRTCQRPDTAGREKPKRKRKFVRGKWAGWGELAPGQFAALLHPDTWETMEDAARNISSDISNDERRRRDAI